MIAPLLAAAVALAVSLAGTGWMARFLRSRGQSQPILTKNAANLNAPEHLHKRGTPTMGGIAIVAAALAGYLVSHVRRRVVFSNQTLIVWGGVLVMGGIGFIDDWLKVRSGHNRGVLWSRKGWITLAMAIGIAVVLVAATDIDTRISLTPPCRGGTSAASPGCCGPVRWCSPPPTPSTSPTGWTYSAARRHCSASARIHRHRLTSGSARPPSTPTW